MPLLLTPRPLHPAGALPGDSAALLTLASRPRVLSGAGSPRGSHFPLPCCGCCGGGVQERCQAPRRWHPPRCQADGAAPSLPPGLSQEGCGRGGRQAGGCEPPLRRVLLPAGQRVPLGGGTSPRTLPGRGGRGLGAEQTGLEGFAQSPGVHEGVCPKKTGCSYRQGAQGLGFRVRRGLGTSSAWLCQEAGDDGVAGGPENLCCYLKKKKAGKKRKKKKDFSSSCG